MPGMRWRLACDGARDAAGDCHHSRTGKNRGACAKSERSIEPFVIDRKNFLFASTPRRAKASAIMFSIIKTAKENGLDPFAYLTYVFKNAPNCDIKNDIDALDSLLPHSAPDSCKAGKSQ